MSSRPTHTKSPIVHGKSTLASSVAASERKNTPPTASSPSKSDRKNTPPNSNTPRGGGGGGGGAATSSIHHGDDDIFTASSSVSPDRHHHHHKKAAHFVLEAVKLKRIAIISNDMLDNRMIKFDTVGNIVSIPKSDAVFAPLESPESPASGAGGGGGANMSGGPTPRIAGVKVDGKPVALNFNEVSAVSDTFGACAELQLEVDRFFETGLPLVGSDSTPDADALIVVSAGPDGATASKLMFTALDTATKYMAHRSLCVHVSAVAIFGKMEDMLANEEASVTMFDLLEQGAHRNQKPLNISEPFEPFFDRYNPKHCIRVGLSADDAPDKLTRIKITCEDQIVRNYPKALAFAFFIDCIHFRDGFHRFTSDSHVKVQSVHASSSLFFSRTTVLCTHSPAVAATMVGYTSPLTETALQQPWSGMLRHLGAEAHHVLSVVAVVPEASSVGDAQTVETIEDVDSISFEMSATPETLMAREDSVANIRMAFEVSQMLQKAATGGARAPLPDHIFPKRVHVKLPEYVGRLKQLHDDLTGDQKVRQSFAKSAMQYLSTQCHSDDIGAVASYGGFSGNQEKFAAIFRAAFVKQKAQQQQADDDKSGSGAGGGGGGGQQQQRGGGDINASSAGAGGAGDASSLSNVLSPHTPGLMSQGSAFDNSRDAQRLRQQNEALTLVKERLEFDLGKLEKESRKLRSDLSVTNSRRKRVERELMEAQGIALAAETSATKTRTEANAECLELRQKLVNMQLLIDAAERKNEQITSEMKVRSAEFDRREQQMQQEHEVKFGELEMQLKVVLEEKKVLEEALQHHTEKIDDYEERVVHVDVEKRQLMEQLSESSSAIEAARVEARRTVEKAARGRAAEREEYTRLLEAGKAATDELVTFEELRVDRVCKNESVYRTGSSGVKGWLSAIQQGQYASNFEGGGFNDVVSVANIQESDLQGMRILAGHRRRILASAAELKTQLSLAIAKRQMVPLSADVVTFEKLVGELREWFRDFASVVRAEQINDDEAAMFENYLQQ